MRGRRTRPAGPTVEATDGWRRTTARIAVPISWPTVSSPTVSRRPVSSSCRNWLSSWLVSIATVILPLPNWSIHMNAACSSVGRRRTISLPTRRPVAVTFFSTFSRVSPERSASRASCMAALPMSIDGSRIAAVSWAWMTAFIASVRSLSSRRPCPYTAPMTADMASPIPSPSP